MSGILFSNGRDFDIVLGASMRSIASQGLVLFASSIAFGLALGASNARLVLTHV